MVKDVKKLEEDAYAAADTFIKELKAAYEWMIFTDPGAACMLVLRVRDRSMGPWEEHHSPDPLILGIAEWQEFADQVEAIVDQKQIDRLLNNPEAITFKGD